MARVLSARPLSRDGFAPFGDVIDTAGHAIRINGGTTDRFDDLARLELGEGRALLSLFRTRVAITLPYRVALLECHPLGSQAFVPRQRTRFLIVVAPPGPAPDLDRLEAFLSDGFQGVNYHPGTWHLPLAGLTPADYVVVDRGGAGDNCLEFPLDAAQVTVSG